MSNFVHRSQRFIKRNASTILTCVGGAGVIATSIMAVKATPKAIHHLELAKEEKGEELTVTETVLVAGRFYIPSVLVGASTIACIFGANALNKRQQASLMSAYALLNSSYTDYKNKVKEMLGEEGHAEVRNAIAKDKYEESDISVSADKELFYDEFVGEYFESTMIDVLNAEYNLNRDIQLKGWYALDDFYNELGIDYDDGGVLGWSEGGNFARYWQSWVDFSHTKAVLDDGLECTIITMWGEPYPEWEDE